MEARLMLMRSTARAFFLALTLCFPVSAGAAALKVDLQNATATFSQTNSSFPSIWDPSNTIDGNIRGGFTSWATKGLPTGPGDEVLDEVIVWETSKDLSASPASPLRFSLHFKDRVPINNRGLGRFLISYTRDARADFADGRSANGDVVANWVPIAFDAIRSDSGETFEVLPDGSTLARIGSRFAEPTYEAVATLNVAGITGFRLDTIQHPSLPEGGPGFGGFPGEQNFHLSEFEVHVVPLPLSGALLASGILVLGLLRRSGQAE